MLRELDSYHRPDNLRDALRLLQLPHALALAGGTELLGRNDVATIAVIDLQDAGLEYVRAQADGIRIGAMTRLQSFIDDPLLSGVAGGLLRRAAALLAGTDRHAATIGGTVAAARFDSDLIASLLVLDPEVVIQTIASRSQRSLDSLLADRSRLLTPGALITELFVPVQPTGAWFGLERLCRTPADRAIVCLAARAACREGKLSDVRIAAGGVAEVGVRLTAAEALLNGASLAAAPVAEAAQAAQAAASPPGDHRATAEYRRAMLGVLLARVVNGALVSLRSEPNA